MTDSLKLFTGTTGRDCMRFGKKRIDIRRHVACTVRPVEAPQSVASRPLAQHHASGSNEHGNKHDADQLERAGNRNLGQQHGSAFLFSDHKKGSDEQKVTVVMASDHLHERAEFHSAPLEHR